MHWFWRMLIAVVIGIGLCMLLSYASIFPSFHSNIIGPIYKFYGIYLGLAIIFFPILVVSVSIYGVLTKKYGPKTYDPETRCRKCGYILRGITEPRCPECGEKI